MPTRRDFIKMIGVGIASLLLGCSSKPSGGMVRNMSEKLERVVKDTVQESKVQDTEPSINPYHDRYETNFPKYDPAIRDWVDIGLPDFPGYRLKHGNYAIDKNGKMIPPEIIEKRDDAVWYSYNSDALKDIDGFVWKGIIIDATEMVNENPYAHPWHPDNEKHYKALRSILFPHNSKEVEGLDVKKVSLKFNKKTDRNKFRHRYMLETEIDGTPIFGNLDFTLGYGGTEYYLELPIMFVSINDLDRSIYSAIKNYIEKKIDYAKNDDIAQKVLLSGATMLVLNDENDNGVFELNERNRMYPLHYIHGIPTTRVCRYLALSAQQVPRTINEVRAMVKKYFT